MRVQNLAINQNGFAFDPTTGESFTVNETAKEIIESLSKGMDEKSIADKIAREYDVSEEEAFNDVLDFKEKLKLYGLLS
ncbi:PqqD family protein [Nitrosophilus alvini]|uniref:PqqD family protein n=1 Tax=Nitrosophilus alvini TaxID=2714855 RepID=UPI00190CDD2E|nr:PqqD family protein [Nitrosophilus alvini]